ncbi:MAG: hypothetical protein JWN02_688, partial [Acidobacteria bacterium]|nr:hypothetical protein [Acidobacteriota bacterium]
MQADDPRPPLARLATPVVAAALFFVFAFVFLRMPLLNDSDSYYHLAVARLYAHQGLFVKIPWARFSLLAGGGDKELLFHLFLIPFVTLFDPAIGGRLALAFLNTIVATILTWRAIRALGWSGILIAPLLWIAAPPFLFRAVRLRPEWLALIIILLAITLIGRASDATTRRNHGEAQPSSFILPPSSLLMAVLAFFFTLAYTAFHVFLALCFFWALYDAIVPMGGGQAPSPVPRSSRLRITTGALRAALQAMIWPIVGALLALALHPYPLHNLKIWYVQNVLFFLHKHELNVGIEIRPPHLSEVAIASLGWLIAIAAITLSGRKAATGHRPQATNAVDRPRSAVHPTYGRQSIAYATIAALVFTVLFLFMTRMATYAFPLLTLVALEWAARRSYDRRHDLARAGVFAICCLIAIPQAEQLRPVQLLLDAGNIVPERAWESFGRAIPPGAKVATDWISGEHYAFWAPQGRYLN